VNASTATATTATAEPGAGSGAGGKAAPVGRFAPSPTGPLHLGSLLAALASCLDARSLGGRWLLRIDDLDAARCQPAMAAEHQHVLAALGFCWDGQLTLQSTRQARYQAALEQLRSAGLAYPCSCSRRELGAAGEHGGYPGTCRPGPGGSGPMALRYRYDLQPVGPFEDLWQGRCEPVGGEQGDPVIRRRDGLAAYQLAVVLDDHDCGVTRVVRGADLLPSTFWQRSLQSALGLPEPVYGHIPLLTEADGGKLSKSRHSLPLAPARAPELLTQALGLLGQHPPEELAHASVAQCWDWALAHWNPAALRGRRQLALAAGVY
jgi:glutamyl-Q tRNA(Asp) synthetase